MELSESQAHGKVDFLHNICAECPYVSSTRADLEQHASSSGHTAFACTCGAQFSRAYTLTRHINSMMGPSFACGLCDDKSFPRRDKLGDHLRKWHRLGDKAYDQYKCGSSPCCPASLPLVGGPPLPSEEAAHLFSRQQMCAVAPGFGPVPMFNGFTCVSNETPDTSMDSGASPASSPVGLNIPDLVRSTGQADLA